MLDIYEVEINGYPATLQLTEEDAKLRGLKKSDTVEAKREAADRRAAAEAEARAKADAEAKEKAEAAAKAKAEAANKARTAPANKAAGSDTK